jgi:ubiquitin-protein ligase
MSKSSHSDNISTPVNERQSSSTNTGGMQGLSVSDQSQQQPATVAATSHPNDNDDDDDDGALVLLSRVVEGPTAIPADEEESLRFSFAGELDKGGNRSATSMMTTTTNSDVAVVLGGLVETPRNVTTDYEDGNNNDDDEDGDVNAADGDEESDYSYTYDEDDEGQFTGFLIPTEPFETVAAVSSSTNTSSTDNTATAAVALGGKKVGAAVVLADDYAAPESAESWVKPVVPPHTISRATSGMDSSSTIFTNKTNAVPETNPPEGERKQKWREPTRAAVNMSLRAEKEKTGGRRRLASDLYKIMTADTKEAGFSLQPSNDDSMDKWCIKLFGFDEDSNLAKDLLVCGMDHVELEMSFPEQYPFEPPFVRVVKPRFKRQTGFVMSGALCMELLTKDGWNPINDIESVIVSIRSLMVVGDGRLQAAVDLRKEEYDKILKNLLDFRKSAARKLHDENEQLEDGASDIDEEYDDHANAGVDAKRKRAPSDDSKDDNEDSSKSVSNKPSPLKKASGGSYTVAEAQSAYDHLSNYHKQEGWDKNGWWSRKG